MRNLIASLLSLIPLLGCAVPRTVKGEASYYAEEYNGRAMANGQPFDASKMTLATYEFPLGTRVKITYISKLGRERFAYATVTDRGPAAWVREQYPTRKFDLSRALFKRLEAPHVGRIQVIVEAIK